MGYYFILAEFSTNIIFLKVTLMDPKAPLGSKTFLFTIAAANIEVIVSYHTLWMVLAAKTQVSVLANKVRTTNSYIHTPKCKGKV